MSHKNTATFSCPLSDGGVSYHFPSHFREGRINVTVMASTVSKQNSITWL